MHLAASKLIYTGQNTMYSKQTNGFCPYCNDNNYSTTTTTRTSQQIVMQCLNCSDYSIRMTRNGSQYPLQNKEDPESSPTTKTN